MSSYRKGYRREKQAREYMEKRYGCICIESRGSHGTIDLICGNGMVVYAIQVKDPKHAKYIDVNKLKQTAHMFKAIPLIMTKTDYKQWVIMNV